MKELRKTKMMKNEMLVRNKCCDFVRNAIPFDLYNKKGRREKEGKIEGELISLLISSSNIFGGVGFVVLRWC